MSARFLPGCSPVFSNAVVAGTAADPTSLDLDAICPPGTPAENVRWRGLAPGGVRRPTVLGVAPPTVGTPRPLRSGDSGRYSIVDGKPVR